MEIARCVTGVLTAFAYLVRKSWGCTKRTVYLWTKPVPLAILEFQTALQAETKNWPVRSRDLLGWTHKFLSLYQSGKNKRV
ncbi:hypothetical protein MAR_ORF341 [Marseillevirus marseillevirus]|uniref:Uncharacterized protein n=1 Tax=Marseillevirus marseillevirus TaxID=694581 RepID=D2XAY1_GBMV|nr:hypothetical protein MAR_ORF341 [Marseillevirus marseillevirus]ADB04108.1 hypothetical protein MAR_ORF341 [Marseillevirus marseillevirus]